jgi:uncharacterized membrane protein
LVPNRQKQGISFAERNVEAIARMEHELEVQRTFGERVADGFAAVVGSWPFIIVQSLLLGAWVILNVCLVVFRWDPYPFILLNLAFSTQAAYAAPLILLAQTRQADRDKASIVELEDHREAVIARLQASEQALNVATNELRQLLVQNTELTQQDKDLSEQIAKLTTEIHARLTAAP